MVTGQNEDTVSNSKFSQLTSPGPLGCGPIPFLMERFKTTHFPRGPITLSDDWGVYCNHLPQRKVLSFHFHFR